MKKYSENLSTITSEAFFTDPAATKKAEAVKTKEKAKAPEAAEAPEKEKRQRKQRGNIAAAREDLIKDCYLYSLTDLENLIGVSHRTLLRYIKEGSLKARMIGGRWRVDAEELRRFVGRG